MSRTATPSDATSADVGSTALPRRALGDFTADGRLLMLVAMAVVVGAGGAGAAWVLIRLITLATNLVWFGRFDVVSRSLEHLTPSVWMVAAPALGGLVIGLMARFGSEKIRGHGIPEAIEAILIGGSRMSPKVAVLKPVSSAISIGTGGPFGAEGPIIMTGGAIGSLFAQCFHLSAAERKTLLVAGAAAGMTAIFGTPVAAVLLAVELLLFEWRPRSFIPVAVAAVVSTACRPWLFEAGPLFPFVGTAPQGWGLLLCAGLGVLAGLQSALLTKLLYGLEDAFERLPIHWMWWPALGGLAVGLGGLVEPRALGVGYDVIRDLLSGHLLVQAVVTLLVVKALIWLVALSSGTSGGGLAPLLILGGAMGWLVGHVLPGDPGFWALLGMAAMLGGTMRSPLMSVVFAVELTGDWTMLAPLLAASAAAYATTVLLLKRSILTEKIARRGRHISREYGVDPYELVRIAEVMVEKVDTLPADLPIPDAVAVLQRGQHRIYPVVDLMLATDQGRVPVTDPATGRLVGLVTRKDLLRIHAATSRAEGERQAFFAPARRG